MLTNENDSGTKGLPPCLSTGIIANMENYLPSAVFALVRATGSLPARRTGRVLHGSVFRTLPKESLHMALPRQIPCYSAVHVSEQRISIRCFRFKRLTKLVAQRVAFHKFSSESQDSARLLSHKLARTAEFQRRVGRPHDPLRRRRLRSDRHPAAANQLSLKSQIIGKQIASREPGP